MRAFLSDSAQRLLTLNKRQQKRSLSTWLHQLSVPPGSSLLDFGCGTGLFASMLQRSGFRYCGYDPDSEVVSYARRRYSGLAFVSHLEEAAPLAPFDIVIANCCFHHISDDALLGTTLPAIASLMNRHSRFLLIDVLPLMPGGSPMRRAYNVFEAGHTKRTLAQIDALLAGRFAVRSRRVERSFAFSAALAANPLYNDLALYELALT